MYKKDFTHLKQHESPYKSLFDEVKWELASMMALYLKSFYKLTKIFLGTKYPTTNLFFSLICKMKLSINEWHNVLHPKYTKHDLKNIGVIFVGYWLYMFLTLGIRRWLIFFFLKIYEDNALKHLQRAYSLCEDLIKHYESMTATK